MAVDGVRALVERVYPALAAGDRGSLLDVLHPDFDGHYSPGLPAPIGGHHSGAFDCIKNGWWAIGALFAVRAEPHRWLDCGPDELLVVGDYTGSARSTGRPFAAPFAHLWTAEGDRLRALRQYTDSALWRDALEDRS